MFEFDDEYYVEEDKIVHQTPALPKEENGNEEEEGGDEKKDNEEEDPLLEVISIYNNMDERTQLLGPHYTHRDTLGMTITSGVVTITKDQGNLIGISIGGGAPLCPCLYIVQVFDNTPAAKEGTLESGDELVGVNGQSVKGKTKVEVAKMIQACKGEVQIKYNKLHADPQQGKSLDIILKKEKHRLVEKMSTTTADALGLSRAILCNDLLVKKLESLEAQEATYRTLIEHTNKLLNAFFLLLKQYKAFGDVFAGIGVREPQPRASEVFNQFGNYHRQMAKLGVAALEALKPILSDLETHLTKAIPDTKQTIRKYADTKFEYLSYCLKVKEWDDEEYSYSALQEPLYRVETGNYQYRLILRCRQDARARFAKLRSDVSVKLEMLENKHVQDMVSQLHKLVSNLSHFHEETLSVFPASMFPIEMDLSRSAFHYKSAMPVVQYEDDDEEILPAEEAVEEPCLNDNNLLDGVEQLKLDLSQPPPEQSLGSDFELFKDLQINTSDQLIPGLDLSPTPTDDLIGMH
ncbi:PRKCA-binding protein-like isoform X3 [Homalodisca vitripennis]|uniref:PRKCA-binding protein-like isoform X2 n=1 Tax=Homalodisca vitripennis TaxID=197043 RepID=UPI001EEB78CE|nr:PRKCA-binding protein-like isoform X2 [Homalodisca vitripennis]XP_046686095.1 PRKCA-binding protein-like isoform X3 [Homalodisca vitripennis]